MELHARAGLRQLHVAETEKYAHVTYFFNGGVETPFGGVKNSGYGREKGIAGALDYSYLKSVTVKL